MRDDRQRAAWRLVHGLLLSIVGFQVAIFLMLAHIANVLEAR